MVPASDLDLAAILEALPDGVVVLDDTAVIQWCNARFRDLTGWTSEELVGQNGLDYLDPDQLAEAAEAFTIAAAEPGLLAPGVYRLAHRDGRYVSLELHAAPVDPADPASPVAVMARPIEYQAMMADGVELLNAGGPVRHMATYVVERLSWPGGPMAVVLDDDDGSGRRTVHAGLPPELDGTLATADRSLPWESPELAEGPVFRELDQLPEPVRAAAAARGLVACTAQPVPDPGGQDAVVILWFEAGAPQTYRSLFREEPRYFLLRLALERRHFLRALQRAATRDHLTGLANRAHFFDSVERASREQAAAVLYIDLDDFKPVNDRLGHVIGDAVLAEIGARLRHAVRPSDLAARIGGDEFAVLSTGHHGREEVEHLAAGIVAAITHPIEMPGGSVRVGASIGVAIGAKPGIAPLHLVETADRLLYELKRLGKAGFRAEIVT